MNTTDAEFGLPMFDTQGEPIIYEARKGRHRTGDRAGSIAGARDVGYRSGTQKARLLDAFVSAWPEGLTDEEAAMRAGVSLTSEYSKRCGELRQDGMIAEAYVAPGVVLHREGLAGVPRMVSAATQTGLDLIARRSA